MADSLIEQALRVGRLDIDRLLTDWRWLCPDEHALIARNAFGDLFLLNPEGKVFYLKVATGELNEAASSQTQFFELLRQKSNRELWLAESDARAAADKGLRPNETPCIGFKMPLVFAQSRDMPDNAYIADLYEQVSFLGDLNRQLASSPDGTGIRLRVNR